MEHVRTVSAPPVEEVGLCLAIGLALFTGLVTEPLLLLLPSIGILVLGILARIAEFHSSRAACHRRWHAPVPR
ncbi:MAG TPA: hypothetical protein VK592_04425 [Candidatus Dormibacteraeota bacterium]|nr:hypothetical protein [Candidatus Dormibacteraeota bacterium]